MPTVDNLNIQIKANTTSAIKSLDALEQKLSKVSASLGGAMGSVTKNNTKVASSSTKMVSGLNKTSSAMNKASKSAKSLAASFGLFYANFFLLIRGFKSLWSSIESTADYIEAYNYFNVALGKIGADWKHQFEQYGYEDAEAYAESFTTRLQQSLGRLSGIQIATTEDGKGLLTETGMSNLGMNIKEITQYASQLASVTNSVGQTAETSLAIAGSFTKLAGDISSLFNIDYSSVAKNLQSGIIGQSRALYKFGYDITNATLQTYAYGLGLEKAVSEMTQAEKMQLRVLAILDQSKVAWGDLANTIESPSNQKRSRFRGSFYHMTLNQRSVPSFRILSNRKKKVPVVARAAMISLMGSARNTAKTLFSKNMGRMKIRGISRISFLRQAMNRLTLA